MLLLSDKLIDVPVMSIQTGTELARTQDAIVDPRNLSIVALYVDGPFVDTHPSVLHVGDIRETGELGFIVDDSSVIMSTEGLIRLQQILGFGFKLLGIPVLDRNGSRLGKVVDYVFEPTSYTILQLHIHQSFIKSLSVASNIIHRKQIISVTNERIIVESATIKDRLIENAETARVLVNLFRNSRPESIDRH